MLRQVFRHFVLPRASLAAARLSAAVRGQTAFRVLGENMEPTLPQGTICLYRRPDSDDQLVRGSVVAFIVPEFEGYVVPSRVVAVGGESIRIAAGKLFVNEQRVVEPYVKVGFATAEYSTELPPRVVPAGRYFLLGDYRDASKDSRHLGPILRAAILGLVTPHEA